jgi:hypothetical protein
MYMVPTLSRRYEKLAHYMSNDFEKCYEVPSIAHALRILGQFDRNRLRRALRWGHGPHVRVVPLVRAYGEFSPGVRSNEVRLDTTLVEDFEAGRGIRRARAGNVYHVGVVLLHELTHWCDDQDGIDYPVEEGNEFERLVYGSRIHR